MDLSGTFFAIIPPLVAIILGVITKKVNLSLIIGIITGGLLLSNFNVIKAVFKVFEIMSDRIGANVGVLLFLIMLGIFVILLNNSGASNAYGLWAKSKLKTKRSSLFATFFLGLFIFVDDYFNCLTVGAVMRPVTDKYKVSREKLAYVIDTTAAPICMLAPISSWAAAVSSTISENGLNGFNVFLKSIFFNYYSILSIVLVIIVIILNLNIGKMKKYESSNIDLSILEEVKNEKSRVYDLILPVLFLIVSCILCMLYTGGFFKSFNIREAFSNTEATISLCMGTFFSLIFTIILYLPRKIINKDDLFKSLEHGFKTMVPSILILSFAWTLGGICSSENLNAGGFIVGLINNHNINLSLMPLIFFISSVFLAFATGTSWATFIILIPICMSMFSNNESTLMILTISAILSGSVCGDHLSPLSDTTILSSTGAECDHLNHVKSQASYGIIVAISSLIGYIFAGIIKNGYIGFLISFISLIVFVVGIIVYQRRTNKI